MNITDLFSKRQKRLKGEVPEVFTYEEIPNKLRVQVIHIIKDALYGLSTGVIQYEFDTYKEINNILCREYGKFKLIENNSQDPSVLLFDFFLTTKKLEEVLDVIELTFQFITSVKKNRKQHNVYVHNFNFEASRYVEELNHRFKEAGVGYSFESGQIIRIDSTYMHSEIVIPTLKMLSANLFDGANKEFLKAHEHYRYRRNAECLNECLKAFESTLKIILKAKNVEFDSKRDTAKKLINTFITKGLISSYSQTQFSSLINLLESGIPAVRNRNSGHGQGNDQHLVNDGITRYGLNLTATSILFVVEESQLNY